MTRAVPEKESDIQRTILDWLAARKIFHYRQNSGAVQTENRFFRFGAVGAPDIVAVIGGRYVGIEVKAARGIQSSAQREFEGRLRMAGGVYVIARSLEDAVASLDPLLRHYEERCPACRAGHELGNREAA
jgi:hypothetical protein